ncbi:MAG: dihydropteroate synthase [Chlorobi bacterium]|nr:dihydropteroate synthase [Chlorobiota bacterium]
MVSSFQDILRERVLVFDGATGTTLQTMNLSAEDFGGEQYQGCNEYLVLTRPDVQEEVHRGFLEAGADIIETNTFGATDIVLAEYGLEDRAREINIAAARIGRRIADEYSTTEKPRFVAGSIGPTTKLPSLGHVSFDELHRSYTEQISGLMEGGSDLLCIETCQDILQTKAALVAVMDCFREQDRRLPVIVSVTLEATGTMLLGTEIAAALTTLEPYGIINAFGMNCATGPKEMEENLRYLADNSPFSIFLMPNAGLPENIDGQTCYKLTPEELYDWMKHYVADLGVRIIGGCCGTTPEHVRALEAVAADAAPARRNPVFVPSVSSLFASVPMHLDPPPVLVGERCNANGSKKFKELLLAEDYDSMVNMAKEQAREGAHILDVCVAYVGRNEMRDMTEVVRRFNTLISVPLCFDSTESAVIEAALKLYAGRAVINSINLEDGETKARDVLRLCKRFGAAVIALTIDEEGMARTAQRKLDVARRLRALAVEEMGLREQDLIFDPLTFTLGSGDEEFRSAAMETLEGIRLIKKEFPRAKTLLGVSNVSFGLTPRARHALNSVFLHHAVEAGLDMAIVHASKIMPLYRIPEQARRLCDDLVFDRRRFEEAEV